MGLILNSNGLTFVGEIARYLLALVKDINSPLWFLAFGTFLFVLVFLLAVTFIYHKLRSKPLPPFFTVAFFIRFARLVLPILAFSLYLIPIVYRFIRYDLYYFLRILGILYVEHYSGLYRFLRSVFKEAVITCGIACVVYTKLFLKFLRGSFSPYFRRVAFRLACLIIIFLIIYFLVWPFIDSYFFYFIRG